MSRPAHVLVVGAGMVGLSTAWFLQERGIEVTVLDRKGVSAGASWGNAGWISPALTLPLPEPAIFRFGLKAVFSPSSPVYMPLTTDVALLRFLAGFSWYSLPKRWRANMATFAEINKWGVESFDRLTTGGVMPTTIADPFLTGFVSERDRDALEHEFELIGSYGGAVDYTRLTGDELRGFEPSVSESVTQGIRIEGQHYINPPKYMDSLAEAVLARGAEIITDAEVTAVEDTVSGVRLTVSHPAPAEGAGRESSVFESGAVVIATGTWLGTLAKKFGVKQLVQAGRGYSFSVKPPTIPTHPIYFPAQRVACTPLGDRLRVGGMMEFRPADAAPDPRRIRTMVEAARPMFDGVDWEAREEEWVGSRPCTPDGLPLVGATTSPRVFVAGGHGMWGITLGPLSGRILADQIAGLEPHPLLASFNPLR